MLVMNDKIARKTPAGEATYDHDCFR